MAIKKNDFFEKLLATFRIEADEHIKALTTGLLRLEKASAPEKQGESLESIFREAHSLKGAARAVNMTQIESVCQSLENVFAAMKSRQLKLTTELFDVLHRTVDGLNQYLVSVLEHEPTPEEKFQFEESKQMVAQLLAGTFPSQAQLPPIETKISDQPEKPLLTGMVRIPTAKLDTLLYQVEELLSAKLTTQQRAVELKELTVALAEWVRTWNKISPDIRALRHALETYGGTNNHDTTFRKNRGDITNLMEFLEWNHSFIQSLHSKVSAIGVFSQQDHRSVAKMVDELLEDVKKVLMLPFSSLVEIFPKLVRDLSRDRGKEVQLVITGAEIEIDKRILEEIKDPLIHIVRNCIDHGIEKSQDRIRNQKSSQGTIQIAIARRDDRTIEVLISDDGAGIDFAKVHAAARKLGVVSEEEVAKLPEQETLALIFQSGVSTSPFVTDISGRGLGLAIVREKIEKLGGSVSVDVKAGMGTSFRLALPLTLATFQGTLVRVNEQLYVLPTMNVERVVRVKKENIKTVENKETISLNGKAVALVNLGDVLELPSQKTNNNSDENIQAIILNAADKHIAFAVEEVLHEQQVLVKSLGRQLSRVRNIAGATVLGSGKVVPILNVLDLMKSAVKVSAPMPTASIVQEEKPEAKQKSILVVEDSITSRTLLKNILESAGYMVRTAVDGIDALTNLRTSEVDLVVSDVDMPRMNGFDLTSKIRSDKKFEEIPVVLVTALESREDRERGIDVGANAYIVKSSFDQSNLLEVIHRLI